MLDPRHRFARTAYRLNGPFGLAISVATPSVARKDCGGGGARR
jgi:hypothetical protein